MANILRPLFLFDWLHVNGQKWLNQGVVATFLDNSVD